MNENYTSGVQRLLKISKQESLKIGHSYVGSEHLLLAIINIFTLLDFTYAWFTFLVLAISYLYSYFWYY